MTGKQLKAWRTDRKKSSEGAGLWFGVTGRTWRRWEASKKVPVYVERRLTCADLLARYAAVDANLLLHATMGPPMKPYIFPKTRGLLGRPVTQEVASE